MGGHAWKEFIRSRLPWAWYWRLKRIREECLAWWGNSDLTSLAKIYQTDKWGKHQYTPVYEQYFQSLRYQPVRLLEIGVGGVAKTDRGGNSLRMWKRYFPKGRITGIDLYDKSALQEPRLRTCQGNQADGDFLRKVNEAEGPFDIIIDDGSHRQSHIIASYEVLFPLLKPGGYYVIEDTQTSYWPSFEGSTVDMDTIPSAMNYFISRIHSVNAPEWIKEEVPVGKRNEGIAAIAFYHNLLMIKKA